MTYFTPLIILLLFNINSAFAANFLTLKYAAKKDESLKSIVLKFLKEGVNPTNANDSLKVTAKKNPSVKKWNPLLEDVIFKLYLDPKIVDLKKYREYYVIDKKRQTHHLSVSTLPSIGFFSQSNETGFTVKYNQLSFFSLGANYSYTPYSTPYSFSGSLYYSTLSSTSNKVGGGSEDVSIPGEIGVTVYGGYKKTNSQFSFYGGLDYESFSSFNIQNILENSVVSVDTHNIWYVTAGLNYFPMALENTMFKFSFSKSVLNGYSSKVDAGKKIEISGMKFLVFVNYRLNEKWSLSGMFKNHSFNGDNELEVKRFGVGVGYTFF